ncbi:MAG: hypothetical protein V3W20_02845, partial [Candidatus Neomarinimicrobiota bacterium]
MKSVLLLFITITLLLSSIGLPQNITNVIEKSNKLIEMQTNKPSLICGTPLAYQKDREVLHFFADHPELKTQIKKSANGWSFGIGDTYNWWTVNWDSDPTTDYQIPSTCRGIGDNCYVFIADSLWHDGGFNPQVTQDHVDDIIEHFNNTTANFPTMGIYDVDIETFGEPPDVDGDPRIIILILDIYQDNVGGYFSSVNELPDGQFSGRRSNEAEIYYMDFSGLNNPSYSRGLQAHELQHMIHWSHDAGEMTFVNEGLSMTAEYICGYYETYYYNAYQQNPNIYLFRWDEPDHEYFSLNYARAALWTLYIYEQFPPGILKDFVNNHHSQWGDFDTTFHTHDANRGFFKVFEEWLIANYVNGNSIDTKYIYQYSPLIKPDPVATYIGNPNGSGSDHTLVPFGAEYIKFRGGSDLTITFTGDNGIKIYALKIGSLEVEEVPRDVQYSPGGFGSTYKEVTFLVYNQIQAEKNYSYIATGTAITGSLELAYEDGEPEGYLKFVTGDSSAVLFNGVSGGKLDSIKVAFKRSGKIQMEINEQDGQTFMRGKNLYGPVQVISPDSTASIPYPVPYDNWVKINLTNTNIDATNDFIVSFLIGSNPAEPGIMISSEPDDGVRNSRTYYQSQDTWFYISDQNNQGNIFKYLIRAYVSVGGTTVAIDQNGIVSIPNEFSLDQNYPNPFNPITIINYQLLQQSDVVITIYDISGRKVRELINDNESAGYKSVMWDSRNDYGQ